MTWDPVSAPVDYVILAGQKSPGIAEITGADSPRRIVTRKGYGLAGAFAFFRGIDLAKPTLKLRLYSVEDWDGWNDFRKIVARPPLGGFVPGKLFKRTGSAKALDIWHPLLEQQGIKAVLIENVGQPQQTGDGVWTVVIKMVEYRRPKPMLSKPEGTKDKPKSQLDKALDEARRLNRLKTNARDHWATRDGP